MHLVWKYEVKRPLTRADGRIILKWVRWEKLHYVDMVHDMQKKQAFVITVVNFGLSKNAANFVTSSGTVSLLRASLLLAVCQPVNYG